MDLILNNENIIKCTFDDLTVFIMYTYTYKYNK